MLNKDWKFYLWNLLLVAGIQSSHSLTTPSTSTSVPAKCQYEEGMLENGMVTQTHLWPRLVVHFQCNPGFQLVGDGKQTCGPDGTWTPPTPPNCRPRVTCAHSPPLVHATLRFAGDTEEHYVGEEATVVCNPTYATAIAAFQQSYRVICSSAGHWTMEDGSIELAPCSIKRCPMPPSVPNAIYRYDSFSPQLGEGSRVQYICQNEYTLVDEKAQILTCVEGQWIGPTPTCVATVTCDTPDSIVNGQWRTLENTISNREVQLGRYPVGAKVEYVCDHQYRLDGPRMLECMDNHLWSSIPPQCTPVDVPTVYCSNLGKFDNGFCKCLDSSSHDLKLCEPFRGGVKVECHCDKDFTLRGSPILTCTENSRLGRGVWDNSLPYCEQTGSSDIDLLNPYSTGDITDSHNHVSTLVIVIATACSVLGVLLLVMVIVVFRRRKPRPHLFHPGMTPPPYSRVHSNSLDEHDRMALMAYADATRVHLPSYEEAVQGVCPAPGVRLPPTSQPGGLATVSTDYRPLPSIPPVLRGTAHMAQDATSRHSTVTTSTMNRDGTSEIFGSLDTVNVSMSDASTSVTVETFDSGNSTVSISSRRANAGSLTSSEDNLAGDDAPLLESNTANTEDTTSVCSSAPAPESKEE